MKLISWNVNGLRACLTHGFAESFAALDADIFFGAGDQDAARSGGFLRRMATPSIPILPRRRATPARPAGAVSSRCP